MTLVLTHTYVMCMLYDRYKEYTVVELGLLIVIECDPKAYNVQFNFW